MDDADRASIQDERYMERLITAARGVLTEDKASPAMCRHCGDEIEEQRRTLLAGTEYCFFCADMIERLRNRGGL